jgi:hypothetical protein
MGHLSLPGQEGEGKVREPMSPMTPRKGSTERESLAGVKG